MDILVDRANDLTMSRFNCNAKEFIENGIKKGRHYFYLRDVFQLNDKKFRALMMRIDVDVIKVEATKQDYYKLMEEPKQLDLFEDDLEGEDKEDYLLAESTLKKNNPRISLEELEQELGCYA